MQYMCVYNILWKNTTNNCRKCVNMRECVCVKSADVELNSVVLVVVVVVVMVVVVVVVVVAVVVVVVVVVIV